MADDDRPAPDAVSAPVEDRRGAFLAALAAAPEAFDFYQALRRIEALYADSPRLGTAPRPAQEPVRLGQEPSLAFAPATLAAFEPATAARPARLVSRFFGLFGPNGPLPLHLTEYAYERRHNLHDPTIARFADLFHHRMLSLFYRAWAAAQPTVAYDRPQRDSFAVYVGALFGLGTAEMRDRDAMPDLAKLHFAGRLAAQARNAEGLQALISAFFTVPVRIEEFVGEWLTLPADARCLLGRSRETGGLGTTATVGGRVWSAHHKFRIVVGPMRFAEYERLLPGGDSLARLTAIVRNYAGDELSWDVNLVLREDEVPALSLGRQGRLGWTTWLGRRTGRDLDDLKLRPMARAA
jgi:type VI secretion system protein ImpH